MGLFSRKEKKPLTPAKCPYCDFTTTDYNTLKRHTDWMHPVESKNG